MNELLDQALALDQVDALKAYKSEFYINEKEIYLDGNSLGLMSKRAKESLEETLLNWQVSGIRGWSEIKKDWFTMSRRVAKLSANIVGALPEEIATHSSTTANLHLLLATFYKPSGKKNKIIVDALNFPSDRYAVESFIISKGLSVSDILIEIESSDGRCIKEEDIINKMNSEVALILLPSVLYRSGQLLNMNLLTKHAHENNVMIGFDLSHSAGAVDHKLHEDNIDFAFWCNYKYLNGGPGAPASLFVHQRHLLKGPALWGWFGNRKSSQFDLSNRFDPETDASAWELGTPHIISMSTLEGALSMHTEIGMEQLRNKSKRLTDYLIQLIDVKLSKYGFSVGSPRDSARRGGHVSLEHMEAARINSAMKASGIIPDFRPPNIIRLAPVPLYISFTDVYKAINIIEDIMKNKKHLTYENKRGTVA